MAPAHPCCSSSISSFDLAQLLDRQQCTAAHGHRSGQAAVGTPDGPADAIAPAACGAALPHGHPAPQRPQSLAHWLRPTARWSRPGRPPARRWPGHASGAPLLVDELALWAQHVFRGCLCVSWPCSPAACQAPPCGQQPGGPACPSCRPASAASWSLCLPCLQRREPATALSVQPALRRAEHLWVRCSLESCLKELRRPMAEDSRLHWPAAGASPCADSCACCAPSACGVVHMLAAGCLPCASTGFVCTAELHPRRGVTAHARDSAGCLAGACPDLNVAAIVGWCRLSRLDRDCLLNVLGCLGARDLRAAACACSTLRMLASHCTPSLNVALHPHQARGRPAGLASVASCSPAARSPALPRTQNWQTHNCAAQAAAPAVHRVGSWHMAPRAGSCALSALLGRKMQREQCILCRHVHWHRGKAGGCMQRASLGRILQREQWTAPQPAASWRSFVSAQGLPFWACTASGALSTCHPPAAPSVRGGLFADEPGEHQRLEQAGLAGPGAGPAASGGWQREVLCGVRCRSQWAPQPAQAAAAGPPLLEAAGCPAGTSCGFCVCV